MPHVPPGPCGHPGCPEVRPCPDHPQKAWAGHTARRRAITGLSGSAEQKRNRRILRKNGAICHYCGEPGADQVDHVIELMDGGPDDDSNLAPIHSTPCHIRKTEESRRARRRSR